MLFDSLDDGILELRDSQNVKVLLPRKKSVLYRA